MTNIALEPYLFFTGNAKEAMDFYKTVFGGELSVNLHDGTMGMPAGKVMHAQLKADGICFMGADGTRTTPYETSNITLSLSGTDEATLTGYFTKLSEGGAVTSALKTESWGDTFGTLTDKFGIDWMVNISAR